MAVATATALAAASLAVAAGGTYVSVKNGQAAAKASRQAAEYQSKQNNLQAARQKRDAIRQARLAYGQSQQAAENQGVANSSGSLGGLGSIKSQLGDTMSFLDQYNFLSDQAGKAMGRASVFESRAQTAGAISNLGMTVFSNAQSISSMLPKGAQTIGR